MTRRSSILPLATALLALAATGCSDPLTDTYTDGIEHTANFQLKK